MRLVLISDTHGEHNNLEVPDGDVLVHSGDFTMSGKIEETRAAMHWFGRQPHQFKVMIAGNHDWFFYHAGAEASRQFIHDNAVNPDSIWYLQDSQLTIKLEDKDVTFWGSPWQPWFFDWAFNLQRGAEIKEKWDMIPEGIDVLVTHGPPMGAVDRVGKEHVGCADLRQAIEFRVKPKIHVFGHIHREGSVKIGETMCYNASSVNEQYRIAYKPIVIDI